MRQSCCTYSPERAPSPRYEMVHLLEPTHNARFVALMDYFMPHWKMHRAELNRLPVRHEDWGY
jgi:hypothetical protein